ncbi:MAG: ketoacyl-ACP synthase III [Clostridiales bacterium]|nr:ketoacyl-ACP synthase III [Clostridiales bacterium]
MNNQYSAGIIGTGSYLPEKILKNEELEKIMDTSDEWIRTRTGIISRRIADKEMATSDLATKAAINAMKNANITADELDLIIVATVTPDMAFPSTACIVQKNIGAVNAAAFDMEAACTGFVYALTIGEQFIKTGFYKKILIIGAEIFSKIIDWEDRNTAVLFGDGAGAVILVRTEKNTGIISSYLGSDGKDGHVLTLPGGGSRNPINHKMIEDRLHYLKMDGSEVFKFAVRIMGNAALKVLEKADMTLEDIDFLIPHQANIRIIEASAKRLKLPMDKVYVNLNKYGNISAASVPVALDEAVREKRIKSGDNVLLVAFGAGLTWGSSLIKWI